MRVIMKRHIVAGLSILAVMAGVGLKLANHQETSTRLQDVSLSQHSEHSHPGPTDALARIRIRLSPDDHEINATGRNIPQVSMSAE